MIDKMTYKLKEIDSLNVMPVKKYPDDANGDETNWGHNQCLDAVNQLNVVGDVKALIKIMLEEDEKHGGPGSSSTKQLATAILASMPSWCSLKKGA